MNKKTEKRGLSPFRVLVLATSYLDLLVSHPAEEGKAKEMLDELAANSRGKIEVVYHCKKNPGYRLWEN